jgi:ribonuclease R
MHDEKEQTLNGRHSRVVFRLAQEVEVRLAEASPVTGGLVFHILQGASGTARGKRFRRK